MKELKELSKEINDLIKAKVGGSHLYLQAINPHAKLKTEVSKLEKLYGKKYNLEIKNFIACYGSALLKSDLGFSYSRDRTVYNNFNKGLQNRKPASYRRTFKLLDLLEEDGFIENYVGYKDIVQGKSLTSCCVFTEKLLNFLDKDLILKHSKVYDNPSVIVRDSQGNNLKNIQGIFKVRKEVEEINTWLSKYTFRIGAYDKKINLTRIFNESLQKGGRFYFGILQTISSEKRKSYQIHLNSVAELDYSSQHFGIMACLAGVTLPEDFKPYEVDISDLISMKEGYCLKKQRKILKLACLMLVNSGNPTLSLKNAWKGHIESITKSLDKKDFKKAKENPFYGVKGMENCGEIINRLKLHNCYADQFFKKKDMWGVLQHLDSQIMLNILMKMKDLDIPCLPYHDSLVVSSKQVKELEGVMLSAWEEVLGTKDNCRIDRKY